MRKTRYSVEISYEDRQPESIPLTANTDAGAIKQAKEYLPREDGGKVFLHFSHGDGSEGYLTANGDAVYPGTAWSEEAAQ